MRVPRQFYSRDALAVAPELLNKLLVLGPLVGRIVETEAYCGPLDPASHAYRGRTARNDTMFGRPGLLYVYFSYGVHWCANVVCGAPDEPLAVLLRALAPAGGHEEMRQRRGQARADRELCSGPGKLCQAFGITGAHDGADLVTADRGVWVAEDGTPPPPRPGNGPRVGISSAADRPWRWWVEGDESVSKGNRAAAGRPGSRRG